MLDSKVFLVMLALATIIMFSIEGCVRSLERTRPQYSPAAEIPAVDDDFVVDETYTRNNPEFVVEVSRYASEEGDTVEVKTCGCKGCHWKCE